MKLWPFGKSKPAPPPTKRERIRPQPPLRISYDFDGAREVRSYRAEGYTGADAAISYGLNASTSANADWRSRYDFPKLRAESQRLFRNNLVYRALVNRLVDFILGAAGPMLQVRTDNKDENRRIERAFHDWLDQADVRGMVDGSTLVRQLLTHIIIDGDALTVKLKGGKLQVLPGWRIGSTQTIDGENSIEQGVELDGVGKPIRFHVAKLSPQGYSLSTDKTIDADDCIFSAYRPLCEQTRGEPAWHTSFPMIHRLNDVCDAEAAAWQILSRFAVSVTRPGADQMAYAASGSNTAASDQAITDRIQDVGIATIFHGNPGDELKGIDHNLPNANFDESVKTLMRLIGLPVGFTLEFCLLLWSDTNYSSGRAAIKQVERNCKPWLTLLRYWLDQVFLFWAQTTGTDVETIVSDWAYEWHFEPYPFIDPEKEAIAAQVRMDSGLSSPIREAKALGVEYADLVAEQAEAAAIRTTAGVDGEGGGPAGVDENGNPIDRGAPLNGAQITAAVDVMNKLREGVLVPAAAEALLVAVGIPAQQAATMIASTPVGRDDSAADVSFKREVVKGLIADGTLGDVVFNLMNGRKLLQEVNIDIDPKASEEPWIPVIADNGQPVTGEVRKDSQGDIVGGVAEAPTDAGLANEQPGNVTEGDTNA